MDCSRRDNHKRTEFYIALEILWNTLSPYFQVIKIDVDVTENDSNCRLLPIEQTLIVKMLKQTIQVMRSNMLRQQYMYHAIYQFL